MLGTSRRATHPQTNANPSFPKYGSSDDKSAAARFTPWASKYCSIAARDPADTTVTTTLLNR